MRTFLMSAIAAAACSAIGVSAQTVDPSTAAGPANAAPGQC
jgi:hypothetical protein